MPPRTKRTREVDLGFLQQGQEETDLASLFAQGVAENRPITEIPIDGLRDNPYQPRATADPAGIEELATVIRTHGFQGVLVARPDPVERKAFQLAFGHRRRAAARQAGLLTLPVMVRDLSDQQMVELAIAENVQREDLTALEEGKTFELMVNLLGYTHEQVATAIGKTRGYVRNRLRVAAAPEDIQQLVAAKPDSLRAVDTLVKVKDAALRAEVIEQLLSGRLTTDDLPGYIDAAVSSGSGQELIGLGVEQGTAAKQESVAEEPGADFLGPERVANPKPTRAEVTLLDGEPDERTRARIGGSQLRAALRALTKFRDGAVERDDLSSKEFITLLDLHKLTEELYEHFSPENVVERR